MHWIVTGKTGSGKSLTLKRVIIPDHLKRGRPVMVLDPLRAPDWGAGVRTYDDPLRFLDTAARSKGCVLIIDEYPHFAADYAIRVKLDWCFTIARNYGHLSYVLAQRVMMIHPNVRNQCSNALLFKQPVRDLQDIMVLLDEPGVMAASNFVEGTGLMVQPFKTPVKFKVF